MLAALPSWRAEISSTPFSTRACEILKLAVPSRPKQRRAPYEARSRARTAATVGVAVISPPVSHGPCRLEQSVPGGPRFWPEAWPEAWPGSGGPAFEDGPARFDAIQPSVLGQRRRVVRLSSLADRVNCR